jgi:hypothetical protein
MKEFMFDRLVAASKTIQIYSISGVVRKMSREQR